MVQSIQDRNFCLHVNREKNPENFLVCTDCGIILDEYSNFERNYPFTNKIIHGSPSPFITNRIGTPNELKYYPNSSIYSREIQYKQENKDAVKLKIINESKKLLSNLNLPSKLINEVIKQTLFYYEQFPKKSNYRNIKSLTLITIYFTCLEKNIFLNKEKLFEFSNLDLKNFNKFIYSILRINPDLNKKLLNGTFRKKQILTYLSGFVSQYESQNNPDFLLICKKILNKYWDAIKHLPNKSIAGLVFSLAKDVFTYNLKYKEICSYKSFTDRNFSGFLGIQQSSMSKAKKQFIGYIIKNNLKEVENHD